MKTNSAGKCSVGVGRWPLGGRHLHWSCFEGRGSWRIPRCLGWEGPFNGMRPSSGGKIRLREKTFVVHRVWKTYRLSGRGPEGGRSEGLGSSRGLGRKKRPRLPRETLAAGGWGG